MSPAQGPEQGSWPRRSAFLWGLVLGAMVLFGLLTLIGPLRDAILPGGGQNRSEQARQIIEDSYFRNPSASELDNGSISGMVSAIRKQSGDKFSHYFDPKTFKRFNQANEGQFSGVGLAVSEVPRGLRVSQVYPDTPAKRAGIEVGDTIIAVEGKSIAGVSATDASGRIKGPPGTKVTITVAPANGGKPKEITLERASVEIPAVTGHLIRHDGHKIGYVRLATFSDGAHDEVRSEIDKLRKRGAEGLVFDLRGNGGGLLREGVLIGSIFVKSGPIVITEGRSRPRKVYDATGDAIDPMPLVVLTNRDTASASEIVTAAIKENGLAKVVGTRTYGKGTFQEVVPLKGGAGLDLTVGEYLTANGTSILGKGVKPDVHVADNDASDGDQQLQRGVAIVGHEIASGKSGSAKASGGSGK